MISHRCLKPGRNLLYLPPLVPSRSSSRSPATGLRQSGVRAVHRQKTRKPGGAAGIRVTPSPTGSTSGRHKPKRLRCCGYPRP
jgi:hypothetical protein